MDRMHHRSRDSLSPAFKKSSTAIEWPTMVLSWFEQKAVAILLTLLSLGVKGIRVGPTPPAFISPNVFKVLQDKFDLKLITTPEKDLADILKK